MIVSGDTLGLVKCFEVDGVRVVWSVTLVSRDAVNKTAVTSLASLPRQQVACGMFGLVHIIHTTCGATLQTLTFESGGGGTLSGSMSSHLSVFPPLPMREVRTGWWRGER